MAADGVVAEALEVVEIAEVGPLLAQPGLFGGEERAYAASKSDPERRLAARLAAKRAAARLLGVGLEDVEVLKGRGGPPELRLSSSAASRLRALGADRALVSLTHGVTHAAASVLLLGPGRRGALAKGVAATGVVLAAAVGACAYLAYAPAGDAAPHPFNQDRNAIWLEHRWLERPHSEPEMETLFAALAARGVQYAFPHLIPFNGAGRLPLHSREQMRAFLAASRRAAPGLKVLPWVGGLRVGYRRQRPGSIDLADLAQRQRMVAECRGLVDEGFDGVHVNIEPVDDGNVEFLALLRALRPAVGPDRILSLSAIRPGPVALPMARNFLWTPGYYARVAAVADQVVVMSYDTGLPTAHLYRRYMAWAAGSVTRALVGSGARVLLGIPTYDETGLMHRAGVETPENALTRIVAGLRGVGGGGTFEGVAVYAGWTTDEAEWRTYERLWRGRSDASGVTSR
jgi:phosphopantetheinyl transferase (holo-ACP synthase)